MHDTLLKERMRLPEFQTSLVQTFTEAGTEGRRLVQSPLLSKSPGTLCHSEWERSEGSMGT